MPQSAFSDADFIRVFEAHGPAEAARILQISERRAHSRRVAVEQRIGRQLVGPDNRTRVGAQHPGRLDVSLKNGTVLVSSDCHYWPGKPSTAHRALVKLATELEPKIIVKNGDVLDGASISRHPPINWEERPKLVDEIEACRERLAEVERAAPKAQRYWPLGNHDSRFETRIATVAPEYAKVHGVHLKDHFPGWRPCWSLWINDEVVVKHRFKGGIHATHNNTIWSGKTMVTGHLHSLKVTPFSDYNGTRWGVDTGTLADPYGPQFAYTEGNPLNWRSGFAVLTFVDGRLLWPEVCHVVGDGLVNFERRLIRV
jgi:hypothetical protein